MKVTVHLGAPLSQLVGGSRVILSLEEGATAADALEELKGRYPDFEAGLKGKGLRAPLDQVLYSLFLNARPLSFEQAGATQLRDGDRLYLFLPIAGG